MKPFPPRKLGKPALLYRDCMLEVKYRFAYLGELAPKFSRTQDQMKRQLIVESIALQYRKVIELIAFASIIANEHEYLEIRNNASKDWNAKLIFNDISRINPYFYPKPFKITPDEKSPDLNIIDPIERGFLTQEDAINLYERCGRLLHAQNRYAAQRRTLSQELEYLLSMKERLFLLLDRFETYLIPENHRYWVELFLDSTAEVTIYGVKVG